MEKVSLGLVDWIEIGLSLSFWSLVAWLDWL
jgi:hypothetical protein